MTRKRSCPEIPQRSSLYRRPPCQTLSNALEISRYTDQTSQGGLQSKALKMVCVIENNWLIVESPCRKPDDMD